MQKKPLIIIFLVSFLSGCATAHIAVKDNATFDKYKKIYLIDMKDDPRKVIPKIARRLEDIGFEVVMAEKDEPVGGMQGSGFIITTDGYILTAAHVLNKKDKATVWINGKRYIADVICKEEIEDNASGDEDSTEKNIQEAMQASLNSKDNQSIYEQLKKKDLALLKIQFPDQDFNPLIFNEEPSYKMGEEIYTIGFPLSHILGDTPRLNKGFISSGVGLKDNPNYVQVSAEIQPGNSGSPLLDSEGRVIGLIQMTLNAKNVMENTGGISPQNVNFAIKSQTINKFIEECQCDKPVVFQNTGSMDFESVSQSIAQVRSGLIPETFKDEAKLVCSVSYISFWDMWYRFQYFDIILLDLDTDEVLLRVGQYSDNPFSSEDATIRKAFQEIASKMNR